PRSGRRRPLDILLPDIIEIGSEPHCAGPRCAGIIDQRLEPAAPLRNPGGRSRHQQRHSIVLAEFGGRQNGKSIHAMMKFVATDAAMTAPTMRRAFPTCSIPSIIASTRQTAYPLGLLGVVWPVTTQR